MGENTWQTKLMQLIKRICSILLLIIIVLVVCYFIQPLKKGKGSDETVQYELVNNWLQLPAGSVLGNPAGIDTDTAGNVVVFHRAGRTWPLLTSMPEDPIAANTILTIDASSGKPVSSWGGGLFIMPHGLTIDDQNNFWVTDVGLHQVFKFDSKGNLLMKTGHAGEAGNDTSHFDMPTDVAVAGDGSFYVSDGYGNSRVVKFSSGGKYLFEWGKKGDAPGYFNIPHGIDLDNKGYVYVADRENQRVQMFDPSGRFMRSFENRNIGNICAVSVNSKNILAVDDVSFLKVKHRGSDVLLFDTAGNITARFGRSGGYTGVAWYHDVCMDSAENIYVGDILNNTVQKFRKIRR